MSADETTTVTQSSSEETVDQPAETTESLAEQVARLESELEATEAELAEARQEAEAALSVAKRAQRQVTELRDERDDLRDRVDDELDAFRDDLADLEDRTEVFKHVNDVSGMDMDTRAALCVQTAYNEAQRSDANRGTLTVEEAYKAQGASIDRTRYYDVFVRAETLVGDDDLCYYKKEPRGHDPPSRLVVDLEEGSLPSRVAGVSLRGGGDGR